MNQIIAKIRQRTKGSKLRKVIDVEESLFEDAKKTIKESVPYDPETLVEEQTWYCLNNFSKTKYSIEIMTEDNSSLDCDIISKDEFKDIAFIFYEKDNTMFFQRISKTKLVKKKALLYLGNQFTYDPNSISLNINEYPDAIYDKTEDCLYFRSLPAIQSIFPKISKLYKEATEEEVESFLQRDFISLADNFTSKQVNVQNRKRIAMAIETLDAMKAEDKKNVFTYIEDFCPELKTEKNTFFVNEEKDLSLLLFGIQERLYTTPVSGEKRIANSIIKMNA